MSLALAVALVLALLVGTLWYLEKQLASSGADSRGSLPLELRALKDRVTAIGEEVSATKDGVARIETSTKELGTRIAGLEESLKKFAERPVAPPQPEPPAPPPARPARLVPAFQDDFEQGIANWLVPPIDPKLAGKVALVQGEGVARTGRGALRLSYTHAQGKFAMATRMVGNHRDLARVDLWVRCEKGQAVVFVGATEANLATYGVTVPIAAEAGWRRVVVDFADMQLLDGEDKNGRLDADQLVAIAVGDVTPDGEGENALLIDDFTAFRAAKPGEEPGEF
jgi:hypothetical protein